MTWAQGKKIIFITGKGGVGKSTIALACAQQQAKLGKKTLLAEMGGQSYYADLLQRPVQESPIGLAPNLDVVHLTGESCLREYVLHYLKLERIYKIFFENRVMRALINVAPGLREISILGKITSGIRQIGPPMEYEVIIVDCFATGHALALFRAPIGLGKVIRFGPMGEQCAQIERILKDPQYCSYQIITLLEELPVAETLELYRALKQELGVDPGIICNKVWRSPVSELELRQTDHELQNEPSGLRDFLVYLQQILARQKRLLERLGLPCKIVNLHFTSEPQKLVHAVEMDLNG